MWEGNSTGDYGDRIIVIENTQNTLFHCVPPRKEQNCNFVLNTIQ